MKVSTTHPEGDEIVDLLVYHPMLRQLQWRDARKLWRKLRATLYDALNHWDENNELATYLPGLTVSKILGAWHRYAAYVEFHGFAEEVGISADTKDHIWSMYGEDSSTALRTYPYRLAQFMPWSEAEAIGAKLEASDSHRNVAAVHCALEFARRYGRYWLAVPELMANVTAYLGSVVEADDALQDALATGVCEQIELGGTSAISGRTLAKMYRRVLGEFDQAEQQLSVEERAVVLNGITIDSELELVNTIRKTHRCVVSLPHLAMSALLGMNTHDVLHIVPTVQALQNCSSSRQRSVGFAEVLRGLPHMVIGTADTVVLVHAVHALDLVSLNKLVNAIPSSLAICAIGDVDMQVAAGREGIFSALHERQHRRIRLSDRFPALEAVIQRRAAQLSWLRNGFGETDSCPDGVQEASADNMLPLARKALLKAASLGSSIVVTETDLFADNLNRALYAEAQDVRDYLKQDLSSIELKNGQRAGLGDPIVYNGQDLTRSLLRGAYGTLNHIYTQHLPVMLHDGTTAIFVAEATFDTAGKVTLTQDDLTVISLGFAIPFATPVFGRFDESVCTVEEGVADMSAVLLIASSISDHCHPIINASAIPSAQR
jgi:hypothetical protein